MSRDGRPPRSRGFAMTVVIAIFVMLAVLGSALVVLTTAQHAGAALDLEGIRAYQAARGGLDWGLYQVLRTGGGCPAVNGVSFPYGGNLAGFRVSLTCSASTHDEAGTTVTLYDLVATGCNDAACPTAAAPPPAGYVERQVRAVVGSN